MAAALRVLLLTGARKTEILSLKWSYLDLEFGLANLPDSKTGFKVLQLPAPAVEILKSLPKLNDEYVFPSFRSGALTPHISELRPTWMAVLTEAGLTGHWRIHDLRHGLASAMGKSGVSLPFVGKILGHTQATTTERYAHLEANPARQALEATATKITESWNKAAKME
jgi:integrase